MNASIIKALSNVASVLGISLLVWDDTNYEEKRLSVFELLVFCLKIEQHEPSFQARFEIR